MMSLESKVSLSLVIFSLLVPWCGQANTVFRSNVPMISAKIVRIRRSKWFSMSFSPFVVFLVFIPICSLQSTIFMIFSAKPKKSRNP